MSEAIFVSRGGDFATARRGTVADDLDFILAKHRNGVPMGAIAQMVRRSRADVEALVSSVEDLAHEPPLLVSIAPPGPAKPAAKAKRRGALSRPYMRHREMPPRARAWVLETCAMHGVSMDDVLGDAVDAHISRVRQEAYWRLSKAGYNNVEIGQFIGARDPSTVRSGIKAHVRRFWLGEP